MGKSRLGVIFVSYSWDDREVADAVVGRLQENGFAAWIDRAEIRPGQSFVTRINQGLRDASYLLLLISPSSMASSWVTAEWAYALDDRATVLIPVLVAPCDVPPLLRTFLHIDLVSDRERGLTELVTFFEREEHAVAEPIIRSTGPRLGERLLAGATRRELRIVAKTCIDEGKLQELLWDWDLDLGSLQGHSHHQRILHLLQSISTDGQLDMFAEWAEQEASLCVRHQLSKLRGG